MAISIAKAIENTSYPFNERFSPSKDILIGRLAEFVGDCTVDGTFIVIKSVVMIDANVSVDVKFQCDNCLNPSSKTFSFPFNASYAREGSVAESDYTYENHVVEILDAINECILLNMPTKILCQDDCKGLCPTCGLDLNTNSCGCYAAQEEEFSNATNPFSQLKDYNIFSGGASNGSTKA